MAIVKSAVAPGEYSNDRDHVRYHFKIVIMSGINHSNACHYHSFQENKDDNVYNYINSCVQVLGGYHSKCMNSHWVYSIKE